MNFRKTAMFVAALFPIAAISAQVMTPKPRAETRFGSHLPPAAIAAMQSIRPDNIEQQVRFLSHDLLEGRGTGQRGGDLAAEYIATQFALYGLQPAGDNGSYLQKVPMVGIAPGTDTRFTLVSTGERSDLKPLDLKPLDDYVAYDQTQQPESNINAEIFYVGYGIEAPEYHWDDYKGVDVKGKVLLMLVNEPPSDDPTFFAGKALTYYGRWVYKYEEAARKGAVGVILIHKTEMASYTLGRRTQLEFRREIVSQARWHSETRKPPSWIHLDVARKFVSAAGMSLDKMMADAQSRDFKPVAMNFRLAAHMTSKIRPFDSNNVVAVLPGSDKELKDQGILYTAHYDHFGIRPDMGGDNIFNGAMDNATGCGILLEIARVYAHGCAKAAALDHFLVGYRRRTGIARLGISGQASANPRRENFARSELRQRDAARRTRRSRGFWGRAHYVLSGGTSDGAGFSFQDSSRCTPRSRTLLPLRSFQPGACRHSRRFQLTKE